jgi:hypothetical protein
MEDEDCDQLRRRHQRPLFREQLQTDERDALADADPFSYKAVLLPDADRRIDAFVAQVDPPIGDDTLQPRLTRSVVAQAIQLGSLVTSVIKRPARSALENLRLSHRGAPPFRRGSSQIWKIFKRSLSRFCSE